MVPIHLERIAGLELRDRESRSQDIDVGDGEGVGGKAQSTWMLR